MRKLLFILVSIFILLSCENNSTDSIKNETDLNTFITTKLAGTWKVEGKLEGTEFWQFKPFILSSMWGTKYDICPEGYFGKDSFLLYQAYENSTRHDISLLPALDFKNDSIIIGFCCKQKVLIKIISAKSFKGKYEYNYELLPNVDIIGTLIE